MNRHTRPYAIDFNNSSSRNYCHGTGEVYPPRGHARHLRPGGGMVMRGTGDVTRTSRGPDTVKDGASGATGAGAHAAEERKILSLDNSTLCWLRFRVIINYHILMPLFYFFSE